MNLSVRLPKETARSGIPVMCNGKIVGMVLSIDENGQAVIRLDDSLMSKRIAEAITGGKKLNEEGPFRAGLSFDISERA